jgi:hypothetical protein
VSGGQAMGCEWVPAVMRFHPSTGGQQERRGVLLAATPAFGLQQLCASRCAALQHPSSRLPLPLADPSPDRRSPSTNCRRPRPAAARAAATRSTRGSRSRWKACRAAAALSCLTSPTALRPAATGERAPRGSQPAKRHPGSAAGRAGQPAVCITPWPARAR